MVLSVCLIPSHARLKFPQNGLWKFDGVYTCNFCYDIWCVLIFTKMSVHELLKLFVWFLLLLFSPADQAWTLLKVYLDRFGSKQNCVYYKCVCTRLLSMGCVLPTWLVNAYKVCYYFLCSKSTIIY